MRALSKRTRSAPMVIAVDMSLGMLRAAHEYARREGLRNIAFVRAPVERLPIAAECVDAFVCGGSLNEFRSMRDAFVEARHAAKPDAQLFAMSLTRAHSLVSSLTQRLDAPSGIRFPALGAFNGIAYEAGWPLEAQKFVGVVAFSLMRARADEPAVERCGRRLSLMMLTLRADCGM
ncbi:MAG: class I SAM-dependent methyltransferase [Chloroflexi bacterium]|nr:class I SAM-dependent methyltransferase [Chloroflexota bacterium]